ncbi:MAG: SO2930 family diheme c-type cytochrome [Maricaulaceae bacterium]
MRASRALFLTACAALTACQERVETDPVFFAAENPAQLSDWNVLRAARGELILSSGVLPYDLNTPLFSDYAHKLRTIWLPETKSAAYTDETTFDFPVGTIISKTFYYPRSKGEDAAAVRFSPDTTNERLLGGFDLEGIRLIETRLLVRRAAGWEALPYVWNADQTDAVLKRTGDIVNLSLDADGKPPQEFSYVVPNANQCAGCHATNATTREIVPIGPKARHLNKDYIYKDGTQNQLVKWGEIGALTAVPSSGHIPKNAQGQDLSESLESRARAYLDINCSHCHNAVGPADTSGLMLDPSASVDTHFGICKSPIAAGTGTGGRLFGIVPGEPERSILTFRMASTDPAAMMPELGRSLAHTEGVELIEEWVRQMEGDCND